MRTRKGPHLPPTRMISKEKFEGDSSGTSSRNATAIGKSGAHGGQEAVHGSADATNVSSSELIAVLTGPCVACKGRAVSQQGWTRNDVWCRFMTAGDAAFAQANGEPCLGEVGLRAVSTC